MTDTTATTQLDETLIKLLQASGKFFCTIDARTLQITQIGDGLIAFMKGNDASEFIGKSVSDFILLFGKKQETMDVWSMLVERYSRYDEYSGLVVVVALDGQPRRITYNCIKHEDTWYVSGRSTLMSERSIQNIIKDARITPERFFDKFALEGSLVVLNDVIQDCSDAATAVLGYSHQELTGKKLSELFSPTGNNRSIFPSNKLAANEEFIEVEAIHGGTNQKIILHTVVNTTTFGSFVYQFMILQDITFHRTTELNLHELNNIVTATLNSTSKATFTLDLNGRIIKTNKDCETLLGYSEEDYANLNDIQCLFDQNFLFDQNADLLGKCQVFPTGCPNPFIPLNDNGFKNVRLKMVKKTGEVISVWFSSSIVKIAQGFQGYVAVVRDISEDEDIAHELELSRLQLSKTLENSKLSSWVYDVFSNRLVLSAEAEQVLGFDLSKFDFNFLKNACAPEDWDRVKLASFELGMGKPLNIDLPVNIEGKAKYLNIVGYPFESVKSSPVKFAGTVQDITERKIQESNLLKARKEAEKAVKAKDQFLANMSHEIRTPLNAIIGYSRLLKEKLIDPKLANYVETIAGSGKNLLRLINEILDLTKLEVDGVQLERVPIEVRSIFGHAQNLFAQSLLEKKIGFTVDIDDSVPQILIGDPFRLGQILQNLVGNAAKFTESGKISITAKVESQTERNVFVRVEICDTGIGIPEENLDAIFSAYKQADTNTTRKFGGTGLGLSIVKHLVNLFEGEISVRSTLGEGSCFSLLLPFGITKTNITGQQKVPHIDDFSALGGLKILAAEDNEVNQLLLKEVFSDIDCSVTIVNNGVEVLDALNEKRYDIILMDLQMPQMDGYETTINIRHSQSYFNNIPIIALSADALTGEKLKCREAGMNDYLPKPYHFKDLAKRILYYTNRLPKPPKALTEADKKTPDTAGETINLGYLRDVTKGRADQIGRIINLFLDKRNAHFEEINQFLQAKDYANLAKAFHKLKGSINLFGQNQVLSLVIQAENLCKTEAPNFSSIKEQLDLILATIPSLESALKNELANLNVNVYGF